ncbi:hypothetical protein HDU96_007980 [Phlyctochytrium bullatum]|nr:hypothetical protein HDU96_007980 [Phlyctochytrium bullatum]
MANSDPNSPIRRSARGFIQHWIKKTPVESYPLLLATVGGVLYGVYILSKKAAFDPDLRIRPTGGTELERWEDIAGNKRGQPPPPAGRERDEGATAEAGKGGVALG